MRAQARALTALVVEDDGLVRCDIVGLLHGQHWTVLESTSAEAAIELLPEHDFDVVFTDIQLAGRLTGWDVAEAARRSQPHIHVIYTSSKVMESVRRVERSQFFAKPYVAEDIVVSCKEFVGARPTLS